MLGGSGALPPDLRQQFTEGQRSVLTIIAGEVKRHGICDLPIDKIAALAGVCRTTVQTTLHLASGMDPAAPQLRCLKLTRRPREGAKSLTNIIEITSLEWRAWLKRGSSAAQREVGSSSLVDAKKVNPTKSIESYYPDPLRTRKGSLAGEVGRGGGGAKHERLGDW